MIYGERESDTEKDRTDLATERIKWKNNFGDSEEMVGLRMNGDERNLHESGKQLKGRANKIQRL